MICFFIMLIHASWYLITDCSRRLKQKSDRKFISNFMSSCSLGQKDTVHTLTG
jgi:hypothetical protein